MISRDVELGLLANTRIKIEAIHLEEPAAPETAHERLLRAVDAWNKKWGPTLREIAQKKREQNEGASDAVE